MLGSSLAHLAEPMNAVEFEDEIYIADRGNNRVVAWPSDGSGTMVSSSTELVLIDFPTSGSLGLGFKSRQRNV